MTTVNEIIEINISRQTSAVTRASFSIPCFIAAHTVFSERAKRYTSLTAVTADFPSTTSVYKAAAKLFGQTLKPTEIVVGRRQVDSVTGSITTVSNSAAYSLTINGTLISITSDASATAVEIVAALKVAFDSAAIAGTTLVDNLDGTFVVAQSTAGTAWSIIASSNISLANATAIETWAATITAVELANPDWYALTAESHVDADILAIAEAIEARKKIYVTSSSSAAIKTSSTTDIASLLNAAAYNRTAIMFSSTANSQFPECAWIGGQLPYVPGSSTFKFKQLAGVTRDVLTDTESGYCKDKNCNTYETVGGQNIATEGQMASGEFIDVMIGVDWTEARMRERIYFRLVNTPKIPFTRNGTTIIENEIRAVLAEGIENGLFARSPQPKVFMPDPVTMDPNVKALRRYEGIQFTATLAGAIHFVSVVGTCSI